MRWRVGVDIGGTFTDLTLVGDDGRILLWKEDTTSGRLEEAVERGLAAVAGELGLELGAFLRSVDLFVHGSTVATNAVITRRGPRVGLICTGGFRDVLLFRDGFKWDRYNPRLPRPADFVDRWLRLGVDERMTAAGTALRPLDEESVRAAARRFAEHGVELQFLQPRPVTYRQYDHPFVPGLSIVDVMMFNSRDAVRGMLGAYDLV